VFHPFRLSVRPFVPSLQFARNRRAVETAMRYDDPGQEYHEEQMSSQKVTGNEKSTNYCFFTHIFVKSELI